MYKIFLIILLISKIGYSQSFFQNEKYIGASYGFLNKIYKNPTDHYVNTRATYINIQGGFRLKNKKLFCGLVGMIFDFSRIDSVSVLNAIQHDKSALAKVMAGYMQVAHNGVSFTYLKQNKNFYLSVFNSVGYLLVTKQGFLVLDYVNNKMILSEKGHHHGYAYYGDIALSYNLTHKSGGKFLLGLSYNVFAGQARLNLKNRYGNPDDYILTETKLWYLMFNHAVGVKMFIIL